MATDNPIAQLLLFSPRNNHVCNIKITIDYAYDTFFKLIFLKACDVDTSFFMATKKPKIANPLSLLSVTTAIDTP